MSRRGVTNGGREMFPGFGDETGDEAGFANTCISNQQNLEGEIVIVAAAAAV